MSVRQLPGDLYRGVQRLLAWVGVILIRGYQLLISPLLPASCRYYPSCSNYALQAVRRHGLIWGSLLAGWRLLRCNPWTAGGVDDIPQHGWRESLRRVRPGAGSHPGGCGDRVCASEHGKAGRATGTAGENKALESAA